MTFDANTHLFPYDAWQKRVVEKFSTSVNKTKSYEESKRLKILQWYSKGPVVVANRLGCDIWWQW